MMKKKQKLIKDMTEDEIIRTVSEAMHQEIRPYLHLANNIAKEFYDIKQGLISAMQPPLSNVKKARLLNSVQNLISECQEFIDKEE